MDNTPKTTDEKVKEISNVLNSKREYRELKNYVSGFNPSTDEIQFKIDGTVKAVSYNDLVNGFDVSSILPIKEEVKPIEENIVTEEVKKEEVPKNITLNDVKTLVELNNKETLDKIFKQATGEENIDISKILNKSSNNLINSVSQSMNENRNISTELYKYDALGNLEEKEEVQSLPIERVQNINNGYEVLSTYVDVAKIYGIEYTPEEVQMLKDGYEKAVNERLIIKEEEVKEEPIVPDNIQPVKEEPKQMALTPNKDLEKAGFADIFILAIIVLVYAAIIINLIMKLS